jgi:hypothetical protein
MNGYIITEEMIESWRNGCVNLSNPRTNDDICKKCKYRGKGWRNICCDFDDNSMEDIFRSNPYNPQAEYNAAFDEGFEIGKAQCETHHDEIKQIEREKVLDKVIQELNQAAPEIEGDKLFITVLALMRRIDKLRQEGKDGEP